MSKSSNIEVPVDTVKSIGALLRDKGKPLKQRFRALFTLKNIGGPVAIDCIVDAFVDEDSALLKHELAYCLGQMGDPYANPDLVRILEDEQQEPIVRHESGEALGAIGSAEVLAVLERHLDNPVREIAETCQLAVQRIKYHQHDHHQHDESLYNSVDPAPPATSSDVAELRLILLDDSKTLYDRYRAMFALRNIGNVEAVLALTEGLFCGGALFRHEVAFVLGQLQREISVPMLIKSLRDVSENEMVRHECAEALGAIATDECRAVLSDFLTDEKRVVRESCDVALDMCDYENSDSFQYADALVTIS